MRFYLTAANSLTQCCSICEIIEASGRVVACFSLSLTEFLFNLRYGRQILFFSEITIFPAKILYLPSKIMLLSSPRKVKPGLLPNTS